MAFIEDIIRVEEDNTLSFGNYESKEKLKADNFEVNGDIYQVRTYNEATRITKNSGLLLESVPGSVIEHMSVGEKVTSFDAYGMGGTQFTLELESDTYYTVYVDDVNLGKIKTSLAGKLSFSTELSENPQSVRIEKH